MSQLSSLAPSGCAVARIGGDEFAIAFAATDATSEALELADLILEFFSYPVQISGRPLHVGASIGVSVSRSDLTPTELVRQADVAMYKSKDEGRGKAFVFEPSFDENLEDRRVLEEALADAIGKQELRVVFQPIVDSATRMIVSVEALVRWNRIGYGPVSPEVFIPVAESCGLIEPIGAFVLETACQHAARWPGIDVAVNISPVQLRNPSFADAVLASLDRWQLQPSRLTLELAEGCLIQNPERAKALLSRLQALGVKTALDDFGAGFASVGYLRQFGFDRLKIDRSLVDPVDSVDNARKVMFATVALAHSLDLPVTAEGVEREEQAAILHECGCDRIQGYLIARPIEAQHITALIGEDFDGSAPTARVVRQ